MKVTPIAILVLLVASLCQCSTYQSAWREAAAKPVQSSGLEGAYEGKWVSEATGHEGKLRCVISKPEDAAANTYDFHYWAKWGLLSGDFKTPQTVTRIGNIWHTSGAMDLGSLGGVYEQEAMVADGNFESQYTSSKGDRGTMSMTRAN